MTSTATEGRRIRGKDAEERRAERREQLLEAALELFATDGYHNTTIEQICTAAYVGTKGFYEAFESREACFVALADRLNEQITGKLVQTLAAAPDALEDAVPQLIGVFTHALVDDPRVAKILFGEAGGGSSYIERRRRANRRSAATLIETVWQRYGQNPAGSRVLAIGLAGGLFDIIADRLMDADPATPGFADALIADLISFFQVTSAGLASISNSAS